MLAWKGSRHFLYYGIGNLALSRPLFHAFAEATYNLTESGSTHGFVVADTRRDLLTIQGSNCLPRHEVLMRLSNMALEKPRTTRPPDPEFGYAIGGAGIRAMRRNLLEIGGKLSFGMSSGGVIVAEMFVPNLKTHIIY